MVADDGFDGNVVRVANRGIERCRRTASPRIRIEAGEPWDAVVAFAVAQRLAGIEALSGIPGSAGAAPIQNIGAYGQELSDTPRRDRLPRLRDRRGRRRLAADDSTSATAPARSSAAASASCCRSSSSCHDAGGLSDPIAYAQLATALGVELGARVPLADARDAVLALRASKGMVLEPGRPRLGQRRLVLHQPDRQRDLRPHPPGRRAALPDRAGGGRRACCRSAPRSRRPTGRRGEYLVKLSAAWLIERAGIARGFALPGLARRDLVASTRWRS